MKRENSRKLNQLLQTWPYGVVYTANWLYQHGIKDDRLSVYRAHGWVDALSHGAVVRSGDKFDWTGGLWAIQQQLGLKIHAGAKTALELQGYAHFLPLGKGGQIWLFGTPGQRLPAWFRKYDWSAKIRYVATSLFAEDMLGLTEKKMPSYAVKISAPERAMFEMLHLVPQESSFEGALHLMEGLTTLRPELVQTLLERCWSVKVKRLFLFFAEKCNHPWLPKVSLKKVKLGKGKRLIVKGGRFDSKYQISVPA